jgi:hypothetical protein
MRADRTRVLEGVLGALLDALPKCTVEGCTAVATKAFQRGIDRYCDRCGAYGEAKRAPSGAHVLDEAPDYPRAHAVRCALTLLGRT